MINILVPEEQNKEISTTLLNIIKNTFPIDAKYHSLELIGDIKIKDTLEPNDFPAQRETRLNRKSWQIPVYGTLRLIDKKTGAILDTAKDVKIANIPKLTNRFSMLIDGNEYTTTNQFRLKPGVYTRIKNNGELESQFNLEIGFNFDMRLDPEEGIFYLTAGNQNYHLYTLLHAFGIDDSLLGKSWGQELLDKNRSKGLNLVDKEIPDLYEKVRHVSLPTAKALPALKAYFDSTKISPETTKITLDHSFDKVSPELLIQTSKKLLAVMRHEKSPDERDSLLFKELNSVSDLLNKYFTARNPIIQKNLAFRTDNKNAVREIISSETFGKPIKDFFTVGDLSNPSPQTNPVEMLNEWRKTTVMGTGGVQSSHAITYGMRDVHPTHLGFLDPIMTPESHKAGVTLPLTVDVEKRGNDLLTPVINSSGKKEFLTPFEFFNKKIGFPDQHKNGKALEATVKAMWQGRSVILDKKDIDAYVQYPTSMFAYTTNLVPFLMNDSGNRALVAAKMVTQSVPLKTPDVPYVRTATPSGETFETIIGTYLNPRVPRGVNNAVVSAIDDNYITLKTNNGVEKVGLYKDFPFNQESFIDSTPIVKVGDKVTALQELAKTNFNGNDLNGKLSYAPGLNVNVAYMPWHGYNFEDAAVMTESLAKRFTSESIMHDTLVIQPTSVLNLKKFLAYFPTDMTSANAAKLDEEGIIKEGSIINPEEIMIARLEEADLTDSERILKTMNRSLAKPYRNRSLVWDHDTPGVIKHVRKIGNTIYIYTKVENPLVVGDKIAGRHGNKHIISKIIRDDEAPYTLDGTRIDLMLNPHGVIGRMNMGQMLETAAGKLAVKTGKQFDVKNFSNEDYLNNILTSMKKNNIEPDELLLDGKDGKPFPNKIFWGNQHILKLMHVVEHKLKTRDLPGSYDVNEQPSAGTSGGQSVDHMQMYAYLAHGAKENLREIGIIKGQKNDEYWRALQLGLMPPQPQKNFVFDKFLTYLKGAGVNVVKNGYQFQIMPLVNSEVLKMSNGEITDPGHLLVGKNLAAIEGGLFDKRITGGLKGDKWSHITLPYEIPNPVFEPAIRAILNLTTTKFDRIMHEAESENNLTGAALIKSKLDNINVTKAVNQLESDLQKAPASQVDKLHKQLRYLGALKKLKLTPSEAYMMKHVPILPPIFRPVFPLESGDLKVTPINKHYRDVGLILNGYKNTESLGLDATHNLNNRIQLYQGVKALMGLIDPITYTKEKYEGILKTLAGEAPKKGFIQDKVWAKTQDLSARSTVTIEPSLGLNEVGLPDVISKSIYRPFIIRELVQQGLKPTRALEEYNNWSQLASSALTRVMQERPVLLNRAPSLHKHSVQAFIPVRFDGSSIRLNPLIFRGFNVDVDGDTMSVQVPVSTLAIEEAKNMMPSKIVFKAGDKAMMTELAQDYMLGLYFLTVPGKDTGKKFKSIGEAKSAGLGMQDMFQLNGEITSLGKLAVNSVLPAALRSNVKLFDSKEVNSLLRTIARDYPNEFANVISSFKDLGHQYAYDRGTTLSILDMNVDHSYRDDILKKYDKMVKPGMTPNEISDIYQKATADIKSAQDKLYSGKNRFYEMLNSGSSGKAGQVRQILSMPGIIEDIEGRPIPHPIRKSWSEGLDAFDYWNSAYGARKGVVDRSVNTAESGHLNKELLMNTKNLLIVEDDCGTTDGIELEIIDKHIMDRYLLKDVHGVGKRNDLVDNGLIAKAQNKKINTLWVRSPLTCLSDNGVCIKCYGLMANGAPPRIGENVGVIDAQAVTERSTQLTMQTFHSGGSAGAGGGVTKGFPRIEELLRVPEKIVDKATLAEVSGNVTSILANPVGGYDVTIGNRKHFVSPGLTIVVTVGQHVQQGDVLSTGSIKPQELSTLKSHLDAQRYIVDEINNIYDDKFHKKTFESVLRGISNNAEITDVPEGSNIEYRRGDTAPLSKLKKINQELVEEKKQPIKYTPFFKSIAVLPSYSEDWLSQLTTNRLRQVVQDAAATGMVSNIHSVDPMPGFLYGLEFNRNVNPKEKKFY